MKKITLFLAFFVFVGVNLLQAQQKVTGVITSAEDGNPIPGVNVVVKDQPTIGTATDIDGRYTLTIPSGAKVLLFTSIGMEDKEVEINGRTEINLTMEPAFLTVDEVVVTALGIKREKREVTYQTQKVVDDELVTVDPVRAATAMVGKVAGLQINVQDNGVNPSTQILLRGQRSISSDNTALIVIDGSISTQAAFDDLNPNDIANISVLKGATAAALYGSKAGNGALIVTTKSGEGRGKFTVGVSSSYTLEEVAYMPDFQTEYGTGWEGEYNPVENTNWGPRFDGTLRQIGPTFPEGYGLETQMVPYAPVKDNLLNFYDTGFNLSNTVYISGSSKDSKFYLSFGDQRANGIVPEDTYERNTVRVNASKKIGDVELAVTANYFTDETDVVGSDIGDQDRPLYWFVLNTSANIPLESYSDWQDPKGYGYADNYYNAYYQNPYWAIGTNRNNDKTQRLSGNVSLTWNITDWLDFTGRLGANNVWGIGKNWKAAQTYDPELQPSAGAVSSFVEDYEFQRKTYTGDAIFTGEFEYQEDFTLKVIGGASFYNDAFRESTLRANNLSIPGFYDISNGTGSLEGTVDEYQDRTFGFYGDLTFGFRNYLFLNVSGRNDWTSTLDEDNNSYFYPAFGLSFVLTDAVPAITAGDILTYAKITLSNSTVYNDLDPYGISEAYGQSSAFPFGSINGFFLTGTAVDEEIKKEQLNTNELGLNMSYLLGRLWSDFSIYRTITSDLITSTQPSETAGATSYLTNIGEVESKGLEFSVGGTLVKTSGFKWDMTFNYSSSEMIINEITDDIKESVLTTTGQYGIYAIVGEAFPQIKANVYKRDPQGRIVVDPVSGWPIQQEGLKALGKTTPDYIAGLNTVLSYKGLSLSGTLDYRTGHVYYEQGSDAMEFTGRSVASVSANRQDFVIPNSVIEVSEGVYEVNTNIPVSGGNQSYWTDVYNDVKSNYVKDATALKIRELSLGYELPEKILSKTPLKKVNLAFIARNLITWLPKENRFADPEFNNTNSNAIGIGGYFQAPPTRSYGFKINVEF